jgi:signal transduction histidine kinase/CheY-like chemotaxis protein
VIRKQVYILIALLIWGNVAVSQEAGKTLSKESQQIAVDAILDRANLALQSNNFVEAQKILSSAREIATDSTVMARTEVVQATFYTFTNQLDQAERQVETIAKYIPKESPLYLDYLLVKTDIQIKKGKYLDADQSLQSINILLSNQPDSKARAKVQYLRANLLLKTSNLFEAITIYEEVIPQLRSEQQFYFEAMAALNLAQAHYSRTELEEADQAADMAIETATSFGFTSIEYKAYNLKSSIARGLGNYQQALEYMDRYVQSSAGSPSASSLNNSSTALPAVVAQKNNEIAALNTQIDELESSSRGHNYPVILLFVLLTLLSLLTLSLFKNNKLRARSNQALEGKNSALIDERDRAKDAAKIKADFLSTITHELRTPMYAVTGLTHLLLEADPRHDQEEHLQTLQSSGEYLLSLIDNILDFNKLEANKVELEDIPFDLKKRLEDITVSLKNQAKEQFNNLNLEFDNNIPSRIKGDPVKVSQIMINLIGNAIKFTKNGNIWIRVNKIKQIDDRCLLHFEVEDNGKGISEEKQQDIFNNFTQEGSSTTREYGGTGLGLAIVKNLVGLMGSDIELDSKVGRGSIFSFDIWFELPDSNKFFEEHSRHTNPGIAAAEEQLREYKRPEPTTKSRPTPPVQEPEDVPVADNDRGTVENARSNDTAEERKIIESKPATPGELNSKKILIVEDNKINQMITRKILEGKNFTCDIANNGIEALGKVKETEYDLILMDIHMPGMDGKQATKEIRKFDRELPIIALTAVTLEESEKEFYEIGFDDIIPKPFKMDEFFDKIQKAFTNYQIY